MATIIRRLAKALPPVLLSGSMGLAAAAPGTDTATDAGSDSILGRGLFVLSYQKIQIPTDKPIDLASFHLLKQVNEWFYAGIGGHAPLFNGAYGGFMAFDISARAQGKLYGNLFADAGLSYGGGGGGRSTQHARSFSGSGRFLKSYAGLGYDFGPLSAGLNLAHVRIADSQIKGSQVEFYLQTPFGYRVNSFERSGSTVPSMASSGEAPSLNRVEIGLDNMKQIKPQGSFKGVVSLVDLQFSRYLSPQNYLYFEGGIGYHGLLTYNQVFGGVGYQYALSPRFKIRSQFAVGSGGYDPEKINTGSGLLLYPKLLADYRFDNGLGLALTGGYLYAPNGSSRNMTFGALLRFDEGSGAAGGHGADATPAQFKGYRIRVFDQAEFKVRLGEQRQASLPLLTLQIDKILGRNFYAPLQASIAHGSYFGYPGYGELLAGIGLQSTYSPRHRFQAFSELLIGTSVRGPAAKLVAGFDYGLSEEFAIHAQVGAIRLKSGTSAQPQPRYSTSPTVGLGLSYRFSLPG